MNQTAERMPKPKRRVRKRKLKLKKTTFVLDELSIADLALLQRDFRAASVSETIRRLIRREADGVRKREREEVKENESGASA